MAEPVLHFEVRTGMSACGRALPTAGFFTSDRETFEDTTEACKPCRRIYEREAALTHSGGNRLTSCGMPVVLATVPPGKESCAECRRNVSAAGGFLAAVRK